jgi:hypothetical protein
VAKMKETVSQEDISWMKKELTAWFNRQLNQVSCHYCEPWVWLTLGGGWRNCSVAVAPKSVVVAPKSLVVQNINRQYTDSIMSIITGTCTCIQVLYCTL